MSLRARITLIITTSFVLLTGVLLFEAYRREAAVNARLQDAELLTLRVSWAGFSSTESQRLLGHFEVLRRAPETLFSFSTGEDRDLSRATIALRSDLRATGFQALRPSGSVIHDSRTGPDAAPLLPPTTLRRIMRGTDPVAGLLRHPDGGLVFAVAAPVNTTQGVAGVAVLFSDVPTMLDDLAESIAMPSLILEGQAVLARGGPNLGTAVDLPPADELVGQVTYLRQGDRTTRVIGVEVTDLASAAPLALVTLNDVTDAFGQRALVYGISYLALGSAMVLFAALVNWSLRTSFSPLTNVIRSLDALRQGRTDVAVPDTQRDDEVGRLAGTFETFRRGMEAQAHLGRLTQELEVATRIQAQCLPRTFPQIRGVEFAAVMQPMREVGGDFYDVFELPDGRVGFVVADVSDKGVGAALFMAIARTAVRSISQSAPTAADCVTRVNDYLCLDNDTMLFVTMIYGILNPVTGEVDLCNAGHNPAVLLSPDRGPEFVEVAPQMALGILEGEDYSGQSLALTPGARVFLYTDGVTEAMTADGQEFGEDRLSACLADISADNAQTMVDGVMNALARFVGDAELNDDVTCLTVRFDPASDLA